MRIIFRVDIHAVAAQDGGLLAHSLAVAVLEAKAQVGSLSHADVGPVAHCSAGPGVVAVGMGRAGILQAGHSKIATHSHVHILGGEVGSGHSSVLTGNRGQFFPCHQFGIIMLEPAAVPLLAVQGKRTINAQRIAAFIH